MIAASRYEKTIKLFKAMNYYWLTLKLCYNGQPLYAVQCLGYFHSPKLSRSIRIRTVKLNPVIYAFWPI